MSRPTCRACTPSRWTVPGARTRPGCRCPRADRPAAPSRSRPRPAARPTVARLADAEKLHRDGTHRTVEPERTLERVQPTLPRIGVTRVAVVTGLDFVGILVVMVCRPNGRSLSVSQGKGVDLVSAKVSGIMEALEAWHAEHILLP